MGTFVSPVDLDAFASVDVAKATEMIGDAEAQATLAAPCIITLHTEPVGETADALALRLAKIAAVRSIIRGAVLRWNDAGSGATVQTQVGPFGQTISQAPRRGVFYPSEIGQLQDICKSAAKSFAVDVVATVDTHAPTCDLMLGGSSCSCGADLAGFPIFGVV